MRRWEEDRPLAARKVERSEIEAAVLGLLERVPQVQAVWLFGSYARGEERRTSDVDLAVMTSRELAEDWEHLSDLRRVLEDLLPVPVDVVVLSPNRPLPLLWEILSRPVLLFARDPQGAEAFASGLRAMVREDWPRLERRWEKTRRWCEGLTRANVIE